MSHALYDLAKPLLFSLSPETAHEATLQALHATQGTPVESALRRWLTVDDDRLTVEAFGQRFPSPVGVAAGFDKNARVAPALAALGFGHVEVGGVTADRQAGNPRPRMFRLPADRAIINRMGFNNDGADAVGPRISDCVDAMDVPLGVNIGKSKSAPLADAEGDYLYTYERVADSDFFVVNVSSPNTPGLRSLQDRGRLASILGTLRDAGADPLLVKLSPDLGEGAIRDAIEVVEDLALDGIVATNTSTRRPASLESPAATEGGGLSGAPVEQHATETVRFVAERTDVPVIGVGGVASAAGAYAKIRAGARVVQLYTGLVYEGPTIARDINRGLLELLDRDGFDSVAEAVGADL